jgi:Ca2+-binding EF-hand superfamily protein
MCDVDGDGKIDYLEFIQAATDHQALLNKENIKSVFEMFDMNHDGKLSIQELK